MFGINNIYDIEQFAFLCIFVKPCLLNLQGLVRTNKRDLVLDGLYDYESELYNHQQCILFYWHHDVYQLSRQQHVLSEVDFGKYLIGIWNFVFRHIYANCG